MPIPSAILWVDSANNRLLSGWQSQTTALTPSFKQGDTIGVEVHWVNTFDSGAMSENLFPDAVDMTLAIGRVDTAPTEGYFTISYGSNTSDNISYSASETEIATILNAMASITADGGVTVTKVNTVYRVVWNTSGVRTNTLLVADNELFPTSTVSTTIVKAGATNVRQVVQLHIKQAPIANITSFIDQEPSAVTVTSLHSPTFMGDSSVWRVFIAPTPQDGTFILSFNDGATIYRTSPISVYASINDIKAALKAAKDETWYAVKSGAYSWDISTQVGTVYNLTANGSGILSFRSKYGVMAINSIEVEDFLAGSTSAQAILEIQVSASGTTSTILQTGCTVVNSLIDSSTYNLVTWPQVMPVDSVVRYDTSQSLTTTQKTQARTNIGALGASEVGGITDAITTIQGNIVILNSRQPTINQAAALNASTTLSGSDKVVANSMLVTGLAGKASVTHSHIIDDITGLQNALNNKADVNHTHNVSDINGLSGQLSQFLTISSLSNIATTDIGSLTVSSYGVFNSTIELNGDIVISDTKKQSNPTSLSSTYPSEILVRIGTFSYAIPCRIA